MVYILKRPHTSPRFQKSIQVVTAWVAKQESFDGLLNMNGLRCGKIFDCTINIDVGRMVVPRRVFTLQMPGIAALRDFVKAEVAAMFFKKDAVSSTILSYLKCPQEFVPENTLYTVNAMGQGMDVFLINIDKGIKESGDEEEDVPCERTMATDTKGVALYDLGSWRKNSKIVI